MGRKLTNEEFLQRLKDENILYIPLEEYKTMSTKIKWLCYKDSKHIFKAKPDHIFEGRGCPYCSGRLPVVGETDLWTTHPEIARMLENYEDGYKYSAFSSHRTNWICPNCGTTIKNKMFKNITSNGLICPICSDGVSYSEKFVASLLLQLNVDFVHDKPLEWSNNKRYDFYIQNYNMIIECHGLQHYEEGFTNHSTSRSLQEEKENDLFKKNIAVANGIKEYIVLDCRKSDKNFIRDSILNSRLSDIFNLSNIDWNQCDKYTSKSYCAEILQYYNNGIKNTSDIAKMVVVGQRTVLDTLHKLAKNGLCDYDSKKVLTNMHSKKVICLETEKIYNSIKETSNDNFNPALVSRCCNKYLKTYKDFHWMFYEDYLKQIKE